mmetsp:Transcript_34443/g.83062  ORF Transcript_34443/g.83062 Transcript_34443/m.83062 type:complete len:154 (+) Transcript_34443:1076-1537(+)
MPIHSGRIYKTFAPGHTNQFQQFVLSLTTQTQHVPHDQEPPPTAAAASDDPVMTIQESGTGLEDGIDDEKEDGIDDEKAGIDSPAHQDKTSSDMGTDHLKSYIDTQSDTLPSESSVCNRSGENANCFSSKASAKVAVDQEVTDGFDVYTGDEW